MIELNIIIAVTIGFWVHSVVYLWPISRYMAKQLFFVLSQQGQDRVYGGGSRQCPCHE